MVARGGLYGSLSQVKHKTTHSRYTGEEREMRTAEPPSNSPINSTSPIEQAWTHVRVLRSGILCCRVITRKVNRHCCMVGTWTASRTRK